MSKQHFQVLTGKFTACSTTFNPLKSLGILEIQWVKEFPYHFVSSSYLPHLKQGKILGKEKFQRSTFWGLFQWNQAIKKRVINAHGISSFLTYWFCDMWLISVFFIYRILKANHDREKAKKEKRKMKQEKKKQ